MKLVNRVSLFFLGALAVVLIAYSSIFYAIVRARLVLEFEQESHGTLNSLVAAIEVEPEEVKWQPLEHTIALGADQGSDEVRWIVIGDGTHLVDKSRNAPPELVAQARSIAANTSSDADGDKIVFNGDWQLLHRRLFAPAPDRTERELDEFDEIVVVVVHSTASLIADLRRLLGLVCVLPLGALLVAAATGHWFCRSALQPVLDMSKQARSMTGADFRSRLPVSETGDELADLAEAFNALLDSQHRAFEQQRRFTGDAAHELRTPLTVLLGQIDVALRRSRSPEEYGATLRLLRNQTVELQSIIESLLFLARAEEDAVPPDSETFSMDEWLQDYLNRWKEHPRRADIRLQTGKMGVCRITASTALLTRLLDNLIENALKYSTPGSRVDVTLTNHGAGMIVAVEDQGCGIPAEDQSAIFLPLFRSRAARTAGIAGAGLGLAIAARIAAVCGGRISCISELGSGSRFALWLPTASHGPCAESRKT
jgi:signal transduction histidine kinase